MSFDDRKIESFYSAIHKKFTSPKIILFGSRLIGTHTDKSDVDFVVLSDSFNGMGIVERNLAMRKILSSLSWPCDIIMRTPKEWEKRGMLQAVVASQVQNPDIWRRAVETTGSKIGFIGIKKTLL